MRKKGITKPDYLDSLPSGTVARSGTEVGVGGRSRGRRFRLATLLLFGAAGLAIVAIQSEPGGRIVATLDVVLRKSGTDHGIL